MKLTDVCAMIMCDPRKIDSYLFDLSHARGGPKGRFFLRFGFTLGDPVGLMNALLDHGSRHEVGTTETRLGATVYTIDGEIESPDGRNPRIRTVWQVDKGTDFARFITTVPLSKGG
jgi:hypothetical protein